MYAATHGYDDIIDIAAPLVVLKTRLSDLLYQLPPSRRIPWVWLPPLSASTPPTLTHLHYIGPLPRILANHPPRRHRALRILGRILPLRPHTHILPHVHAVWEAHERRGGRDPPPAQAGRGAHGTGGSGRDVRVVVLLCAPRAFHGVEEAGGGKRQAYTGVQCFGKVGLYALSCTEVCFLLSFPSVVLVFFWFSYFLRICVCYWKSPADTNFVEY